MSRRRRRRTGPSGGSVVEDSFDLFLDALANTLGVVMFIALMVVVFASPPAPTHAEPVPEAALAPRVKALVERMELLQAELDRLPPEGDPELLKRHAALMQELRAARDRVTKAIEEIAQTSDLVRELRRETRSLRAKEAEHDAQRRSIEQRIASLADSSSFVRVSRFRDDPRAALLLLVSAGAVERAEPAPGETRILPGARPRMPLASIDDARRALDRLLSGSTPARNRIEVGVWSDSFAAFKLLERALVERGFDLNPMPIAVGEPLDAGVGGIQ